MGLPRANLRTSRLAARRPRWTPVGRQTDRPFVQVSYCEVRQTLPVVAGAEFVNDDEICMTCHEAYVKSFANNVHRQGEVRVVPRPGEQARRDARQGAGAGLQLQAGESRGEVGGLLEVPRGQPVRRRLPLADEQARQLQRDLRRLPPRTLQRASGDAGDDRAGRRRAAGRLDGEADQLPHDRQRPGGGPGRGAIAFAPRHVAQSRRGRPEHLLPLPLRQERLAADRRPAPNLRTQRLQLHDLPRPARTDQGVVASRPLPGLPQGHAPTMAWHSSIHELNGVACTDCHNPHPNSHVPGVVNINHYRVDRPKRMPMSVWEPEACYKCHPKIYALNQLSSHHPILEGKMVCSDCHDPHGQRERNLKAETINLLCYKCHMEKQGPWAYPHPPCDENCAICHEPHGAVANNLLRQPPTFLCLRCHAGHAAESGPHLTTGPREHHPATQRPARRSTATARSATRKSTAATSRRRPTRTPTPSSAKCFHNFQSTMKV